MCVCAFNYPIGRLRVFQELRHDLFYICRKRIDVLKQVE